MTDAQLIEQCLNHERLAQKELYNRYKTAMYTLAYRMTNDFGLADEILQDAFLQAFKYLHTFRQDSTFGAWLKTIVVRTAYKKIKRTVYFEDLEQAEEQIDWGNHLDTEYLEQAIQALPTGYRSVFILIEIEGYTHQETGEILGISAGTSKSQLYHAKKRLRTFLIGGGQRAKDEGSTSSDES